MSGRRAVMTCDALPPRKALGKSLGGKKNLSLLCRNPGFYAAFELA